MHDNTDIGKHKRQFKPFSRAYNERKVQLLDSIIVSPEGSPPKWVTFQPNTLHPVYIQSTRGAKRRAGQPRVNWVETALELLWHLIGQHGPDLKYSSMDIDNDIHFQAIQQAAQVNVHEVTPGYIIRK